MTQPPKKTATPPKKNDPAKQPPNRSRPSAEQVVLLIGSFLFLLFVGMMLLFLVLMSGRPTGVAIMPQAMVNAAATRGFVLPPTWTPAPTQPLQPTAIGTPVYDGSQPTRMYTPRPTSLPGLVLPYHPPSTRDDVLDLARILQGELAFDLDAAYYVGWVAKNRLLHPSYGDTYARVSSGFFGYRPDIQPREEFIEVARRIIRSRDDPTDGCLFALSRTDITKLGVPPERADVTRGEWFFFRTWPLNRRL